MVDPKYGGVRMLRQDQNGELPLMMDTDSFIFGTVIAALTTIRSKPILSDWSNLLMDWAANRADQQSLGRVEREKRAQQVATLHFDYKLKLVELSQEFLEHEKRVGDQNKASPFLVPATQATSIAV